MIRKPRKPKIAKPIKPKGVNAVGRKPTTLTEKQRKFLAATGGKFK